LQNISRPTLAKPHDAAAAELTTWTKSRL